MKIGIIVDTLSIKSGTGIARYCQELLKGYSRMGISAELVSVHPSKLPYGSILDHSIKFPYLLTRQSTRFDLIHATSPVCAVGFPFVHTPKIITYHDIMNLQYKDPTVPSYVRLIAPLILRIGKFADRIIVDSTKTSEDIVNQIGISEDKISIVNLGVDSRFVPIKKGNRDYFIIGYVGALTHRKRIDYLLRVFKIFLEKYPTFPARLKIIGRKGLGFSSLNKLSLELGVNNNVEFLDFVPEDELVRTYNLFDVFIFPSDFEGFGLPILEAQSCGIPVVIRKDSHIAQEVTKAAIKATTEENMADLIHQLFAHPQYRSTIIREGLKYSRRFTWEKTVEQTYMVYKTLLNS